MNEAAMRATRSYCKKKQFRVSLSGNMKKLIVQDPDILGGKPVIAGTRMSVEVILEFLAGGMEVKDILKEYPFLKKGQIEAALDFAAKIVRRQESYLFDKARTVPHEISSRY